jgi:hypothetical protein
MELKPTLLENVTVVIRYAGEATLPSLRSQVFKEVQQRNVFIVEEIPFSKAVEKTFSIGIANDKEWTLALDADLLLLPNAIEKLIQSGNKCKENLYIYQAYILDWFRGGLKYGGPHLYKTCNLNKALEFVNVNRNNLRPESAIYKSMSKLGYKVVVDEKIFSIHDFHQSFQDIYRKAYFHGIKHPSYINFISDWIKKSKNNLDYQIAVKGFIEGYYANESAYPSVKDLNENFQKRFDIVESKIDKIDYKQVKEILVNFGIEFNEQNEIKRSSKKRITKLLDKINLKKGKKDY